MKKIPLYSLLLLISLFFGEASNAANINIQLQGISTAELQGEYLLLRGITNSGILFLHAEVSTVESTKLTFPAPEKLPTAPILMWKIKGVDNFFGEIPLIWTDKSYQVVLSDTPQWQGQVETLAIIFPFAAKEIRLSPKFSAEKAGFGDKLSLFFEPKTVTLTSINTFQGPIFFGVLWVKILGWALLVVGIVLWLIFLGESKTQLRDMFLVLLVTLWLFFDLIFNGNIWSNFRTAQASLVQGNYFHVTDFLPSLWETSVLVPHKADTKVEYIGPPWSTYWYTLYLRYELFPTKLTEKHEEADYFFLFLVPFALNGNELIVNQAPVCTHCTLMFQSPTVALFQKKP